LVKAAYDSVDYMMIGAPFNQHGKERKIFRTVTSFGANSLVLEVGLGKATSVNHVTVEWPCKKCPVQVYTGIDINKAYSLVQDNSNPSLSQYDAVSFKAANSQMSYDHHSFSLLSGYP